MKKSKKLYLSALALSAFLVVGCNNSNTEPVKPSEASYPEATLNAKLSASEVEVGQVVTARGFVITDAEDETCTFTTTTPDLIEITTAEGGKKAEIKGLKAGDATVVITPNVNPTAAVTLKLRVIALKPTITQVLKNIASLDSYAIYSGDYWFDSNYLSAISVTQVTSNAIVRAKVDTYEPVFVEDGVSYYGEMIPEGGTNAVYITKENGKFVTADAPVAETNIGLLTADNFKGRGEDAVSFEEVGKFYGVEAFNPEWFASIEKNEDNTYLIDGDREAGTYASKNQGLAFAESMIWELASPDTYKESLDSASGEDTAYPTTLATSIETTITVLGTYSFLAYFEINGNYYGIQVGEISEDTEFDTNIIPDIDGLEQAMSSISAGKPFITADLKAAVAAIKTDNYVRKNSLYPDHETEYNFNTYFTPNYVFYNCNKAFRDGYNTKTEDTWEQIPYGYAKKADGIYKFEYVEPVDGATATVKWSETKEEGTSASSTVAEYANYLSNVEFINNDLIYSFSDDLKGMWSNETAKFHQSSSRAVLQQLLEYYAPEDIPDYDIERALSGIAATVTDGVVTRVDISSGFCPFLKGSTPQDGSYGVDRFSLNDFGKATTNEVDALLGL